MTHVYDWQHSLILISFYCSIGWLTGSMFSKISEPHIYRSTSTIAHLASHATDRPSLAPVLEWDVTYNILYSIHSFLCGISNISILVYIDIKKINWRNGYKITCKRNLLSECVYVFVCVYVYMYLYCIYNGKTSVHYCLRFRQYPGILGIWLLFCFSISASWYKTSHIIYTLKAACS